MISKNELFALLNGRPAGSAGYSDIFYEQNDSTGIILESGKADRILTGKSGGYGIRSIKDRQVDYFYCAAGSDIPSDPVGIDKKMSLVNKADKAARTVSPQVKQVSVSYGDRTQHVAIANNKGDHIFGTRKRTRFIVNVIAEKDGVLQTGYETAGALAGFELFETVNVEQMAKTAAERAVRMLDAPYAPSGQMPVVITAEAGGTLIHEACGHGLEADFIVKDTSVYSGKTGQKVASELVTVIDDASMPGLYGSFDFDDEGTPAQKKVLIENGILKGFMSDIYNSRLLGISSSGNGRREDFTQKPQPRMTNTYIERGSMDPGSIVSSVKNGLLVKKLGGGQVNVVSGDFVFDTQEAYIIRDGKIGELVRGAMLIGNGPKILMDIDMVGNDLFFVTGTCGKGDHAPVTDAMPTVRIPKITVGGRSQ